MNIFTDGISDMESFRVPHSGYNYIQKKSNGQQTGEQNNKDDRYEAP